jgi:hypothetical protein
MSDGFIVTQTVIETEFRLISRTRPTKRRPGLPKMSDSYCLGASGQRVMAIDPDFVQVTRLLPDEQNF